MKIAQKTKMTNSKENLSRPGTIDARARYQAAARRFTNTDIRGPSLTEMLLCGA